MKTYFESFPNERIYIHNQFDSQYGKNGKQIGRYRYNFIFIWRAYTAKGNLSKYYHAEMVREYSETNIFPLPKLPKGYKWEGPFLYGEYNK